MSDVVRVSDGRLLSRVHASGHFVDVGDVRPLLRVRVDAHVD
jgi:hypothetical protein